mmetsp:Transcript_59587/g.141783  ORF Transcript_59587/g.141783 Transcript_59587/m.141783 type:complete len:461 (+) Transcript_59587:135-1517(+)|eukprot:CAMPEP_0178370072 /NCGR_PEP_ID=MMETSP0689_2-20121128/108_1 /TAXON_ID=160604 /ORGANISM="Amphidinium massartii, Strain CS-259" /LENGTH=460 /DNA_ID=CAMNT_0019989871 /DNA_START=54 /DNA_END=1436 /DNA_ORIENTATION=-
MGGSGSCANNCRGSCPGPDRTKCVAGDGEVVVVQTSFRLSSSNNAAPRTENPEYDIKFLDLEDMVRVGRIPRCGSDTSFIHPMTGEKNMNLAKDAHDFPVGHTLFMFVSHRWVRPASIAGHPDDEHNHKCELITKAARSMVGKQALAPEGFGVAIWMDYACVDQDRSPSAELVDHLQQVIERCDLMLTPIVDPEHGKWEQVDHDLFQGYLAPAWKEYWGRAWCRTEALLAATAPLHDGTRRAEIFGHGALYKALQAGRRPHFLYGTKELHMDRPPKSLPPLMNSFFQQYSPETGLLTKESDRVLIQTITRNARKNAVDQKEMYEGGVDDQGLKHGNGTHTCPDGSVYVGQFHHGERHGTGVLTLPDGKVYEGPFQYGKRDGKGTFRFADGGVHVGMWSNDRRNGFAELTYPDGRTKYEGEYRDDRRHGQGRMIYGDGRPPLVGVWLNGSFIPPGTTKKSL